jgi:hypothetical protein
VIIYKYKLDFDFQSGGVATFSAPKGRLLKIAVREDDTVYAWIQHDEPNGPTSGWRLCAVMTGERLGGDFSNDFELRWDYVDTVFKAWLVIHVFYDRWIGADASRNASREDET